MRRGTQQEAIDYCKKGDQSKAEQERLKAEKKPLSEGPNFGPPKNFQEFGTLSKSDQGRRTDREDIYASYKEHRSHTKIIEEYGFGPWQTCYRALDRLNLELKPQWDNSTGREIILLVGRGGIGKSRWVHDNYPDVYKVLYWI